MRSSARHPSQRWLAPAALVACAIAVVIVVSSGSSSGSGSSGATTQQGTSSTSSSSTAVKRRKKRRTYTVKPGDTLGGIAQRTGVPLSELQALNPNLDAQALQTGAKVKLAP